MIIAIVGSGGKTTLLHELARQYRAEGSSVFVTTTTHMFIEDDTLLTDDADLIIRKLKETGYAMAGIPEGPKIRALSAETYEKVCSHADVVLVEADGSRHMPLKFPNANEPVIPGNTDAIYVVCGIHAIGKKAKDVCQRLDLVKQCLGIEDDTLITPDHVETLVREGYVRPLSKKFPTATITVMPRSADNNPAEV